MNARTIIEAMVGMDDVRQDELGEEVVTVLKTLPKGGSVILAGRDSNEAAYIAHVAQGTCLAEFLPVTKEGFYPVLLRQYRQKPADISLWATAPDTP